VDYLSYLICIILTCLLFKGWGISIISLFICIDFFLKSLNLELRLEKYALLVMSFLAVPLSAFFAGALLNKFANLKYPFFIGIFIIFGSYLLLTTDYYFEILSSILLADNLISNSIVLFKIISSILIYGSFIAFITMLIQLLFEMPFYCFLSLPSQVITAVRPITLSFLIALAFSQIIDLLLVQINPILLGV